jgi:hypothetical protein
MKYKIRIVTFNTWHGLDHRRPYLMLPLQSPMQTIQRYKNQTRALELLFKKKPMTALRSSEAATLELCCLQELNPLELRFRAIKNALKARGHGARANAGIRAGYVGLPLFLNEGIATFFRGDLKEARWSSLALSGTAGERQGPFGIPLFFQLGERRVALKLRGMFDGLRVVVIQAHLHAGPGTGAASERRRSEIARLAEWIRPELNSGPRSCDLLLLAGDFNNDPDSDENSPLLELGLESPSTEITWSPKENPLCSLPAGGTRSAEDVEWDASTHRFDRIYHWRAPVIDGSSWGCKIQRVLDHGELSDHFGLMADVTFETRKG